MQQGDKACRPSCSPTLSAPSSDLTTVADPVLLRQRAASPASRHWPVVQHNTTRHSNSSAQRAGPNKMHFKKVTTMNCSSLKKAQPQLFKKRKPAHKFVPTASKMAPIRQRLVFYNPRPGQVQDVQEPASSPVLMQHQQQQTGPASPSVTHSGDLSQQQQQQQQQQCNSAPSVSLHLADACLAAQLLLQLADDVASGAHKLQGQLLHGLQHNTTAHVATRGDLCDMALTVQQLLPGLAAAVQSSNAHDAAVKAATAALLAEVAAAATAPPPSPPRAAEGIRLDLCRAPQQEQELAVPVFQAAVQAAAARESFTLKFPPGLTTTLVAAHHSLVNESCRNGAAGCLAPVAGCWPALSEGSSADGSGSCCQ